LKLKDYQDLFQRAILAGDDTILREIPDGPRENKTNLLGIYRDAYVLRLIEVVASDHEELQRYLGEDAFADMARGYIAKFPSRHCSARWVSENLPEFLKTNEPYARQPILHELATLEKALSDAFDAADVPVLGMSEVAAIPMEDWPQLFFVPHPATQRLTFTTNASDVWKALKDEATPPPIRTRDEPANVIVWRHGRTAKFREMPAEEAMMWAEASQGARFGTLCEMLATFDDPAGAAGRAASYLKGWLDAGFVSEAKVADQADRERMRT